MLKQNRHLWLLFLIIPLFFVLVNEYYIHRFFQENYPSDNRRIIEFFILCMASLSLLASTLLQGQCLNTFLQLPKLTRFALYTFFVIGLMSAAFSPLPKYAFLQVAWYLLLFLLTMIIATLYVRAPATFRSICLITIVGTSSCYCLYAFFQYLFELGYHATHLRENIDIALLAWPDFVNPRFLMQYISWSIPFMVLPIMLHRRVLGFWVGGCYAFAAFFWCLDFANQSRIVPIQIILVPLAILCIYQRQALPWLKQQCYVLLSGYIFYQFLFHVFLNTQGRDLIDYIDASRYLLLKLAAFFAIYHPLLGVGPMHFSYYAYAHEQFAAHPHNALLMIGAEWGIIAMLCLFGTAIWGFWRFINTLPHNSKNDVHTNLYAIALTASVLAASLDAMVDGVAVMPLSQIMLSLISGLMLGMYMSYQPLKILLIKPSKRVLFIGIIVLSLIGVVQGIWPDILYLRENQLFFISQCHNTPCTLAPNFWTQGWVQMYNHYLKAY